CVKGVASGWAAITTGGHSPDSW
nr:immunoglobulin heavy chain junction region [Macaca mulatta]MOX92472.1 immunoglobulin heavy chain junction region [Macaca mulatta]MOX93830.1 immunoglobulin heavy chain junction region [Macaca mulatta]MOX93993.1 immunoglobulin heavy chain junction region [Macaca mulatta]MOX96476.1 immunoglobulin heavy chain junction region [Macaca mulatta]